MTPTPKITRADHALIHALIHVLTVLLTQPMRIGADAAQADDQFRVILAEVLPRVSRDNVALRPLMELADRVLTVRGDLAGIRHQLREPVHAWHRTRLTAAVEAMRGSNA